MNRNLLTHRVRAKGKTEKGVRTSTILNADSGQELNRQMHNLPPEWVKHYRRLLTLRARLEAERLDHALTARQPLEAYSMDMADAATDEFDHDLALGILSVEQDVLYEIDAALKRIETGEYGICEVSGKPIPQARLDALPWTRFAADMERQLEVEGVAHRPHLGELRSVNSLRAGNLGKTLASYEEAEASPSDEILYPMTPTPGTDLALRSSKPVKKSPLAEPFRRSLAPRTECKSRGPRGRAGR